MVTGRSGVTPDRPPKRPQITEKILKQSLEAETALAEALVRIIYYLYLNGPRKIICNYSGGEVGLYANL